MEDTTTTDLVETAGTGAGVHEGMAVDAEGNALTADQVQQLAQPDQTTAAAEVNQNENSTEPNKVESLSEDDKDLVEWAKKKGGFDTEDISPAALKALKLARTTEQQFHKDRQTQSELKRQLEMAQQPYQPYQQPAPQVPQQPLYDAYGNQVDPSTLFPQQQQAQPQQPTVDPSIELLKFQVNHKDYEQGSDLDQEMGKVVAGDPLFWATRLDQAYKIAKANLAGSDTEARIEQARKEERERLTQKSALSRPAAQPTQQTATTSFRNATEAENFLNTASKDEYNAKLPELQAALGIELRPRK